MSARADRNLYWVEMAGMMEQAANVGDTQKLYRLIRQQSKSSNRLPETIRDLTGAVITDSNHRRNRWKEHFDNLLNHTDPPAPNPLLQTPITEDYPIYPVDINPPSVNEIERIIARLKNNKAPGEDGIPAEIFKACLPNISHWLHDIYCEVWAAEVIPQDWSEALLIPFFKKGDSSMCSNYRGISLIDIAGKIFSALLLNRFQSFRDGRTRVNQAGFRRGRGCSDQIFSLRRLLEHRYRYQQSTVTCFIDFASAFDSLHRLSLWRILEADGVPTKLINLIRAFYRHPGNRVLVNGEQTDRFETRTGVRQGCPLSPVLFNFVIDWILRLSLADFDGVHISPQHNITDLDYADDIAIFSEDYSEMQRILDKVDAVSRSVGLRINASKTKLFSFGFSPTDILPISLHGASVEEVSHFKYLGSTFLPNGQCRNEITARIDAARKAFFLLRKSLWSRREISLQTKIKVFQATVRTILLYGCETWPLRVEDEKRLTVFDHRCLRTILRVRYIEKVSNETIRRRCCGIEALGVIIQERRLRWLGHVLRASPSELTHQTLFAKPSPSWRRRRGGQLISWPDRVKADLNSALGPSTYGLRRWNGNWMHISADLAANRPAWKALIRDITRAS
jgi:hypothetical protein